MRYDIYLLHHLFLDYWKFSIRHNDLISKLKVAQNNAARVVLKKRKREHASPLLAKLHWLPVERRITYKLTTLCYKCLNGLAPSYLSELLIPYVTSRRLRSSSDTTRLTVPPLHWCHLLRGRREMALQSILFSVFLVHSPS